MGVMLRICKRWGECRPLLGIAALGTMPVPHFGATKK